MEFHPDVLQSLYYTFSQRFAAAFGSTASWWDRIATEVPSTSAENRYPWMADLPAFREWVGERVIKSVSTNAYALANKDFELTIEVKRNDIDDNNLGIYAPIATGIGQQAKKWPDQLVAKAIQAGKSLLAFDGQNFFDTDHPISLSGLVSGTYANLFTSKPLNVANYEAGRASMGAFVGDNGDALGINANLLVVPPQLEGAARRILNSDSVATAAGTAAETNIWKGSSDMLVVPEFANEPAAWYLADVSKPIKPIVFQKRKEPQMQTFFDPKDPELFWRKRYVYGADSRGNAGFSLPFLMARFEG